MRTLKDLLFYLKHYKKESSFAPLFKLLEATFELIVPLVVARIIDSGIRPGNKTVIYQNCALLVGFAVVGMVMAITAQFFAARAATGFGKELRSSLFGKIQSLSFSELDTLGRSSLITRMTNDVTQAQNGVNLVLRLFLRSPFIVLGATVMAFTIDVRCALIFVVVIAALSLVVFGIMGLTMPGYKNVQRQLDGVTLTTRENYAGARVIRAFAAEDAEQAGFNKRNEMLSHLQRSVGRLSALLNPLTYILINIGIVVLIHTGAMRVSLGDLTQGQVVALYNYMSQILVELVKLANMIITITKALACASRIQGVLQLEPTLKHTEDDKAGDSDVAVAFDDVTLQYKNAGEPSLEHISFTVPRGSVVGIIGGTGSGKSSLVSLIPHFYDVKDGRVSVFGKNVCAYDDEDLRHRIGYVQQKAVLFQGTVRSNLLWGDDSASDDDLRTALSTAQVLDIVADKGGLDAPVKQNGANFSGGQKQRLSVARALVRKPQILVLDDSSSALDYATEAAMRKAILALPYKPTLFIVSQRASSVMCADRILVLEDGRLVGDGTHKALLANCPAYCEIYHSQFSEEVTDA
mgnify:FL=1